MAKAATIAILSILAAAVLLFALTQQVGAQQAVCGVKADMEKVLKKKYKEDRRGYGISKDGRNLYELYFSSEGTFTLMVSVSKGKEIRTCLILTGVGWETVPEPAKTTY